MGTRRFVVGILCLLLLGSCVKDVESTFDNLPKTHQFSISTSHLELDDMSSDVETKAAIQAKISVSWEEGDHISIINLTTGKVLGGHLEAYINGDKVNFKGTLSGELSKGDNLAAFFPSQNNADEIDFSSITFDLSSQTSNSMSDLEFCAFSNFTCDNPENVSVNTKFTIPVSFVQMSLSNLNPSTTISYIKLTRVGNKVVFSNSSGELSFARSSGVIEIRPSTLQTSSNGCAFVYCTMASANKISREITIMNRPNIFQGNWASGAIDATKFYTTISSTFTKSDAPQFSVTEPSSLIVPSSGASLVFKVTSTDAWNVSCTSGISVMPNAGVSCTDEEVNVIIPENETPDLKVFTISFSTSTETKTYQISQSRATASGDYIDEYGINQGPGIDIDGVIWAPVYCGYLAASGTNKGYVYGKLYQWGRKYGQGYGDPFASAYSRSDLEDETTPLIATSAWAGENGAEDQNTFYICPVSGSDWSSWISTRDDSYWNKGTETKPIKNNSYDPCPDGWRLPTFSEIQSAFYNFSSEMTIDGKNGVWVCGSHSYSDDLNNKMFLTMPGVRTTHSDIQGSCWMRESIFNIWSSTPSQSNNSSYFAMLSDGLSDLLSANYGCSVRCVSESSSAPNTLVVNEPATRTIPQSGGTVEIKVDAGPYLKSWTVSLSDKSVHSSIKEGGPGKNQIVCLNVPENNSSSSTSFTVTFVWGDNNEYNTSVGHTEVVFEEILSFEQEGNKSTNVDYIDEYGVNWGPGMEICDVVWAPVFCGYKEVPEKYEGSYQLRKYQWGRKNGQLYYSWNTDQPDHAPLWTGENGDEDPYTVYDSGNSVYDGDWIKNGDNSFWNSAGDSYPVKNSRYDPCPSGWRVPTKNECLRLQNAICSTYDYYDEIGWGFYITDNNSSAKMFIRDYSIFSTWTSSIGGDILISPLSFAIGAGGGALNYSSRFQSVNIRCVQE